MSILAAQIGDASARLFSFDETDIAAALDPRHAHSRDVIDLGVESQVLVKIVFGNVVAAHRWQNQITIPHDDFGTAFDEAAKPM